MAKKQHRVTMTLEIDLTISDELFQHLTDPVKGENNLTQFALANAFRNNARKVQQVSIDKLYQPFITVVSSKGKIKVKPETGEVIECDSTDKHLQQITRFDLDEYKAFYGLVDFPDEIDILDLGYFHGRNISEEPAHEWRKEKKQIEELASAPENDHAFSKQQREDLLVTALEGGSNYWYCLGDISRQIKDFLPDQPTAIRLLEAVYNNKSIPVFDLENPTELLGELSLETISKGEQSMFENSPEYYNQVIEDGWDADTADVWFQYVILNEITFG